MTIDTRRITASMAAAVLAVALLAGLANPGAGEGANPNAAVKAAGKAKKQKKANRKVKRQVKDGNYVGTRGDGESLDHTYCANGKRRTNTGGGTSTGKGWTIKEAKVTKRGFTAQVFDKVKGGSFQIAIAKRGKQWQIGYWFDGPQALGDVERSNARAECKKL